MITYHNNMIKRKDAIKFYSDQEFMNIVNGKSGNIKYFRLLLRANNMINMRERLREEHVKQYKEAEKLKIERNYTWEKAFKEVLQIEDNSLLINDDKEEIDDLKKIIDDLKLLIREHEVRIRALEKIQGLRE